MIKKITIKDLLLLANGNTETEVILASNNGAHIHWSRRKNEYVKIKNSQLICSVVFTEGDALHTATELEFAFLQSKYPKTNFTYTDDLTNCIVDIYTNREQVISNFKTMIQKYEVRVKEIKDSDRYTDIGKKYESQHFVERIQEYKEVIEFCESDKYQEELTEYLAKQKSNPSLMIAING